MAKTVVSIKGQIVIPSQVRKALQIEPGQRLTVVRRGRAIVLSKEESKFDHWLKGRFNRPAFSEP